MKILERELEAEPGRRMSRKSDMKRPSHFDDCERRHHCTWQQARGCSALANLAAWLCERPRGSLPLAPSELLSRALDDVTRRLPGVAAREPTRRHRRHFFWLLGWQGQIADVLRVRASMQHGGSA